MTRKHFVAIADAFKDAETYANTAEGMRWHLAQSLAGVLAHTNPRFDRQRFLDACGVTVIKLKASDIAGTCPACGDLVTDDEPDGPVWTCPADLSERNPFWEPAHPEITEELREKSGVYSNCGDDFGFPCYEMMPLHSECYDKGAY